MNYNSTDILLISYYFAPYSIVGAKRFSYLSDYLVRKGIKTHILTIKEKYIPEKDDTIILNGIIHRTSLFPHYPTSYKKINRIIKIITRFIDPYVGWFLPGIIKGLRLLKKHNIKTVVVTGPPFSSYLIPYFLSFFFKFSLTIDYRDPWFLYIDSSKIEKKSSWFIEKKILDKADTIIFNTNKVKAEYCKLHPKINNKSLVIPNGFIENLLVKPKKLDKDKKVIIYAGNFYGNRTVIPLIKTMIRLSKENEIPDTTLHIFGSIGSKDLEKMKLLNVPQGLIVEHQNVSQYELSQYLEGSDVLYLSQGKDHEYSIPYKLIDYLGVKRPILALTSKNSATEEILRETNCGEIAFVDEPESVYLALKRILLQENKYSFAGTEKYSFKSVENKFSNLLFK